MIDDERRRMNEHDDRIERRNQRLDDAYEYRDTAPHGAPNNTDNDNNQPNEEDETE